VGSTKSAVRSLEICSSGGPCPMLVKRVQDAIKQQVLASPGSQLRKWRCIQRSWSAFSPCTLIGLGLFADGIPSGLHRLNAWAQRSRSLSGTAALAAAVLGLVLACSCRSLAG